MYIVELHVFFMKYMKFSELVVGVDLSSRKRCIEGLPGLILLLAYINLVILTGVLYLLLVFKNKIRSDVVFLEVVKIIRVFDFIGDDTYLSAGFCFTHEFEI